MQPAVIVERLMLLVGATFLSVAFFQFRLNSASNLVGDYDENNEIAVRGRFAKLRPLPYIPPINRDYIDGTGIELVLGKKCLNLLPNSDVLDLQKCMFNPNQNFNWSEYQQLDIANETGHRLCVALSPANNQSLSLESCNKSLSHQKWDFTRISGRYKRYGKLQHLNTGLCLGRNWINVSSESLVVTPCSQPHLRSHMDCDEAWYLPRSHQTYFKKDAKPFALHAIPKNTPHPGGRWKPKQIPKPAGRVLCWVLTLPEAHDKRARVVKRTWGEKCDKLIFVSSEQDSDLDVLNVDLSGPEGRDKIWNKTKAAWIHIYKNHLDDAEWFFKADDDTYMSMSNFQHFFSQKNSSQAGFYGRRLQINNQALRRYYSGGSGYVLSHATLKLLGDSVNATNGSIWDNRQTGPEDVLIAGVLQSLDVHVHVNVDSRGRQLFLPLGPSFEWNALNTSLDAKSKDAPPSKGLNDPSVSSLSNPNWLYRYSPEAVAGPECCSGRWISSHYVRPDDMYRMDNLETLKCPKHVNEWPHWQS